MNSSAVVSGRVHLAMAQFERVEYKTAVDEENQTFEVRAKSGKLLEAFPRQVASLFPVKIRPQAQRILAVRCGELCQKMAKVLSKAKIDLSSAIRISNNDFEIKDFIMTAQRSFRKCMRPRDQKDERVRKNCAETFRLPFLLHVHQIVEEDVDGKVDFLYRLLRRTTFAIRMRLDPHDQRFSDVQNDLKEMGKLNMLCKMISAVTADEARKMRE